MQLLNTVNLIIGVLFVLCYAYQFFYIPIPWLKKTAIADTRGDRRHHYAVMICARNEETVIADLLESISAQTYPQEYLHVFVLADNSTDQTAAVARAHGAVVYERFDRNHVGKGYALDALLKHLKEDYGSLFDAYTVFDADNLLEADYFEQLNHTFCEGHDIITTYRNSKNYGSNWISAGYALWFLRESRSLNHARMLLHTSCSVSGTGFLFSRTVREELEGWPFHLLTEDIEFTIDQITKGRKIAFCPDAVLYDEQPVSFRQSWVQRMRWAKGYVQVFLKYGGRLLQGVLRGSFSCFDMAMVIMPAFILSFLSVMINLSIGVAAAIAGSSLLPFAAAAGKTFLGLYSTLFVIGIITAAGEWPRIDCSGTKKVLYLFTFPVFMMTYLPISISALFLHTTWQPIHHTYSVKKLEAERSAKSRSLQLVPYRKKSVF